MPLQIDWLLVILRLLLILLFYLFLMQVVLAIRRGLNTPVPTPKQTSLGHLLVINTGPDAVIGGLQRGQRYPIEPNTSIGRAPVNTISIPDPRISTEHTRLWYENGVLYVQDAGSVNGTFVNEQPARNALPAKIGDTVRVGIISFQITP